ncbi:MAG: pantetheine-phosphate adenylyltransferase [Chloroflexota bacterium]
MIKAFYPGSFDPVTNGHLDIAIRASKLFDKLVIGVYATPDKQLLFTTEERVELIRKSLTDNPKIEVMPYTGLTVEFARRIKARVMVRGLRVRADFEKEFDLAMMNKKLAPDVELVCLMSSLRYQFLSSSLLKEAASLGGKVDDLVPAHVVEALKGKVGIRKY